MYSTGNLIRSSIVSLIIVAIGLFLLCVSRAPRIETNDGVVSNSNGDTQDPDLLALLNEADQQIPSSESTDENINDTNLTNSDAESSSDNELASLLSEANSAFADDGNTQSKDNEMNALMELLGSDETQATEANQGFADLNLADEQQAPPPEEDLNQLLKTDAQQQENSASLVAMKDEIQHLETVLDEKNSLKQQLQQQIQEYDRQIAELESRLTNPMSDENFYAGQQTTTDYGYSETSSSTNISFESNGNVDDYEITYRDALQLFYDRRYQEAANQFFALLQINPKHSLADNCQYWIGECYYAQGKYYQAIAEFNKVAAFDAGDKKDDAQLMLGLCFLKLGERNLAQTELNWLVSVFARSEYVGKAYHYLNQL